MKPVGVLAQLKAANRPKSFEGRQLKEIRFPLGGIGTGTVSLGGRGQLRDWEIKNRPDKGNTPGDCFPLIRTETADGRVQARVLEGRLQPPFESGRGLDIQYLSGVPRMRSCRFTGAYPFAHVELTDRDVPVDVTLEAFNPLVPGDADASGIPATVLRYHVHNPCDGPVRVAIGYSLAHMVGPEEGKRGEERSAGRMRGAFLTNDTLAADDPEFGSMALAVSGGRATVRPAWPAPSRLKRMNYQSFWLDFAHDGRVDPPGTSADPTKCYVGAALNLPAGATQAVTFVLAWHFPNRTPAGCGWGSPEEFCDKSVGNYYATQFPDAWAAVAHMARRLPKLEDQTRTFAAAVFDTNLPPVAVEAAINNVSTLRSQTCFRTADGRFYGFEGCGDTCGCCMGSCTHVWNYEQTTAFLFPELARSMRETEFVVGTDERGFMPFRTPLPIGEGGYTSAAADGQMGCLMKLYREWQLSGDTAWLERLWPHARRALEFCWVEGGWDADQDGVMEGVQHNTYDFEWVGPNPQCQVWYLGALRAAERMALAVGDAEFASRVRALFEKGRTWTDENLFNGEYYIQKVPSRKPATVAKGLTLAWGEHDTSKPRHQLGHGCLVDQLVGQFFAHCVGLGHLLDPGNVRKAVRNIFRYNRTSMADHSCLGRTYALNDEKGMVICSQPKAKRDHLVHWFFTEFMTGFEYQEAVLLLYEHSVRKGLTAIADVRDRYDGERRNPWNEAECGHHYARAMAAWGALLALSGFQYSAVTGELQFLPRWGDGELRSFWSVGSAWGVVKLDADAHKAHVNVLHGALKVGALRLPAKFASAHQLKCGGETIPFTVVQGGKGVLLRLGRSVSVTEGKRLSIR